MPIADMIPDSPAAPESPTFSGLNLPALDGGATWSHIPAPGYTGSERAFKALVIRETNRKTWQTSLFDPQNQIIDNFHSEQKLVHEMSMTGSGQPDNNDITATAARPNYPIQSASGNVITCLYDGVSENPNAISFQVVSRAPGGSLEFTVTTSKLTPNSRVAFSSPSMLSDAGFAWSIESIQGVTAGTTLGDTFDLTLASGIGLAMTPFPATSSATINAFVRTLAGEFRDVGTPIRFIEPMWVEAGSVQTATLDSDLDILQTRIIHWSKEQYFSAFLDGTDVTDRVTPVMQIDNNGPGAYITTARLSEISPALSGNTLTFNYWEETAGATAEFKGQNARCANERFDFSGSYGQASGRDDGSNIFCQKAATASGFPNFEKCCTQPGVCDEWLIDTPDDPLDQTRWQDLIISQPWLFKQTTPFMPIFEWIRQGPHSVSSLAAINMTVPTDASPSNLYLARGGWSNYGTSFDGTDDSIVNKEGHELSYTDGLPVSAAENWSKEPEVKTIGVNDAVTDAMITTSSPGIDAYSGFRKGDPGFPTQRCGGKQYLLVIPSVNPNRVNDFLGGSIEFGAWDANLAPVASGTVYTAKIKGDKSFDTYSRTRNLYNNSKFTSSIFASSWTGAGTDTYDIELNNARTTATSILPGFQVNQTTSWKGGGGRVDLPDRYRVNSSVSAPRGPDRANRVKVGDVAHVTTSGATAMVVIQVKPHAGSQQSWKTEIHSQSQDFSMDWFFKAFDASSEVFSTMSATRSAGATTLATINDAGNPISVSFDTVVYKTGFNTGGSAGVFMKFSNANIGTEAEKLLSLSVTTDIKSYAFTLDLEDDIGSPGNRGVFQWSATPYTFLSIDSAVASWTDVGEENSQTLDLAVPFPSDFKDFATFEYGTIELGGQTIVFVFPYTLVGTTVKIDATLSDVTIDEAAFYTQQIAIHGNAIPPDNDWGAGNGTEDYESYGRRGDILVCQSEAFGTALTLTGDNVNIRNDLFMFPSGQGSDPSITVGATHLVIDTDFKALGAAGEIYLKESPGAGRDVLMSLTLNEKKQMALAAELDSVRDTIGGLWAK